MVIKPSHYWEERREKDSQRKKDSDEAQNVTLSGATKFDEGKVINNEQMPLKADNHADTKNQKPVCPECGKPMVNAIDSITKKISKYLWETNCGHFKGKRLSIG